MKGINGRTAKLGQMYFERGENGECVRKFCVGYVDGKKVGLTSWELREFNENMPGLISDFVKRLKHIKISIPS